MDYVPYMKKALKLAKNASNHRDVPVGALVIDAEGRILGKGKNERIKNNDPMGHAEIIAIRRAAKALSNWRLDKLTLVVTLEPCIMCASAIYISKINKIVFGDWDTSNGSVNSRINKVSDLISNSGIEVISGVLEAECSTSLVAFFKDRREL